MSEKVTENAGGHGRPPTFTALTSDLAHMHERRAIYQYTLHDPNECIK
jgi:hypothetical protein